MRICNAYSLLKDGKEVVLKNKKFRDYTAIITMNNNAISVSYIRCHNPIDVESIDNQLFCAMLQNEDWEQVKGSDS